MRDGFGESLRLGKATFEHDDAAPDTEIASVLTMASDITSKPRLDTRTAQAERVADYLEQNPASTAKEIDAACDTGCISKVLSAMKKELGYGISTGWRPVPCVAGSLIRRVRTYTLLHRPIVTQHELFKIE